MQEITALKEYARSFDLSKFLSVQCPLIFRRFQIALVWACRQFKGPCKVFFLLDLLVSLQVQVSAQDPALPEEKLLAGAKTKINLFGPISWSVEGAEHGGGEVVRAGVPHPLAEDLQHEGVDVDQQG